MRKFFATLALMFSSKAQPQRVWISEFSTARAEAAAPFAQLPSFLNQPTLDLTGGAQRSAVFNAATSYIRIVGEVQCAITTKAGDATASDILLPALRPEYFGVGGGSSISIIAVP